MSDRYERPDGSSLPAGWLLCLDCEAHNEAGAWPPRRAVITDSEAHDRWHCEIDQTANPAQGDLFGPSSSSPLATAVGFPSQRGAPWEFVHRAEAAGRPIETLQSL